MKSSDLWLVSFGLRCAALVVAEVACFLFVIPTLFNLHRDLADAAAAVLALVAATGGFLIAGVLSREFEFLTKDKDR